jgi:hypothetical protein
MKRETKFKERILEALRYGRAYTVPELSEIVGTSQTSISALLRDLRKPRHGGYSIQTQIREGDPDRFEYYLQKDKVVNNHKADIDRLDRVLALHYRQPFLSDSSVRAVEETVEQGNYSAAARNLGVHMTTVRGHCLRALKALQTGRAIRRGTSKGGELTAGEALSQSTLKIESGIPLPSKMASNSPIASTLRSMKVGDSFVIPQGNGAVQVYRGIHATAGRLGMKVAIRKLDDGQMRIWKVA